MLIKQSCTEYFQVVLLLIMHIYVRCGQIMFNYLAICSFEERLEKKTCVNRKIFIVSCR
jgi:hypothetical protein